MNKCCNYPATGQKIVHIFVQIFVIQWFHDCLIDILLQIMDVHYHAGFRIHRTTNCYLNCTKRKVIN